MTQLKSIVQPGIVTGDALAKIYEHARANQYAIPAVNVSSTSTINAVLEAAADLKSPIIVQFSYGGSQFIAGKHLSLEPNKHAALGAISGALHVHNVARFYDIPVIVHTDHADKAKLPWIDYLIEASAQHMFSHGKPLFSSHMLDLSEESIEENLALSRSYLGTLSKLEMGLEIELGCTGGEEDGIDNSSKNSNELYTTPAEIVEAFKDLTKVSRNFSIAASFGNVHGVYRANNIKLTPSILKVAQQQLSNDILNIRNEINYVFHGGSGCSTSEIHEAISYGVVKINVDTDTQWAYWKGILNYYTDKDQYLQSQLGNPDNVNAPNKKYYDPRVWLRNAESSMKCRISKAIRDFKSDGMYS